MKNFHKRGGGGGLLIFILLFRNLKAQNGIFWSRIGCFDVYDSDKNEVHGINLVEHLKYRRGGSPSYEIQEWFIYCLTTEGQWRDVYSPG